MRVLIPSASVRNPFYSRTHRRGWEKEATEWAIHLDGNSAVSPFKCWHCYRPVDTPTVNPIRRVAAQPSDL